MTNAVLDTSAVLALLKNERGADAIEKALGGAAISTVNLVEVTSKLLSGGMTDAALQEALGSLNLEVVPFDEKQAQFAGRIREPARKRGMSLADCACLSLAQERGCAALTTDRTWSKADFGVEIQLVR